MGLGQTISAPGYAIATGERAIVIEYQARWTHVHGMRVHLITLTFVGLLASAPAAHAACYADYKAKRGNPVQFDYGIVQLSDAACSNRGRAEQEVAQKISRDGWQLLNVVSIFGEDELDAKKAQAGG